MITGFAAVKQNGSTEFGIVNISGENLTGDEVIAVLAMKLESQNVERIILLSIEETLKQYSGIAYLIPAE